MAVWFYGGVGYESFALMRAARREHYVELVNSGYNFTHAARIVGVTKDTGRTWRNGKTRRGRPDELPFLERYGTEMVVIKDCTRLDKKKILPKRKPVVVNKPPIDSRYLSQEERLKIADYRILGYSMRKIAALLCRSASTISRELKRNSNQETLEYEPYQAQQYSYQRLPRPKQRKISTNLLLRCEIQDKLDINWSPEQISNWLKATYQGETQMNVSHETIYQALYVQAKGSLKRDLIGQLRQGRVKRKPHRVKDERLTRYREPGLTISERPAEVEDRAVPGHWEGDLILGKENNSAIGTLVERQTRFVILLHLPGRHTAEEVQEAIIKKMQYLPELLKGSLTWDQGPELAQHRKISTSLNMPIYFCDPHSPWQRGTNENTNGLLRQYFPKGTDLSVYSEAYLDAVALEMNERPRKTLNWNTPLQRIRQLLI